MANDFIIWLPNFGYCLNQTSSLESAREIAKRSGFEAVVYKNGQVVAEYSPISGRVS